jgi:uncharacterized UBP type Zn finger protein
VPAEVASAAEASAAEAEAAAEAVAEKAKEVLERQLMDMGLSEEQCRNAVAAAGHNVDAALTWHFENCLG